METNVIHCADSTNMSMVDDGSVSLIITSPPYNVGKGYGHHNDLMDLDGYLKFLGKVWTECKRVLRPGGPICVNVTGVKRKPYLPLHSYIALQLVDLGFLMRGESSGTKGRVWVLLQPGEAGKARQTPLSATSISIS